MALSLIDIATLDSRIQEQIAEYGSCKDFHLVLGDRRTPQQACIDLRTCRIPPSRC